MLPEVCQFVRHDGRAEDESRMGARDDMRCCRGTLVANRAPLAQRPWRGLFWAKRLRHDVHVSGVFKGAAPLPRRECFPAPLALPVPGTPNSRINAAEGN